MTNYRWNNFPMRFPGSEYRSMTKVRRQLQLFSDLDRVLEEQGFDFARFEELQAKLLSYSDEYTPIIKRAYRDEKRELTPEEEQRVEELGRKEAEAYEQFNTILYPVVNRMLELGYSLEELKH